MEKALKLIDNYDPDIGHLKLCHLGLVSSELNKLKPIIEKLPRLTHLSLLSNKLTYFPEFNLPNLSLLELQNNKLNCIHSLEYASLRHLYLYINNLSELPILNLPKLEELSISYNNFTNICELNNLPKLLHLNVNHNKIEHVEYFKWESLEMLDLGFNKIENISHISIPNNCKLLLMGNLFIEEEKLTESNVDKNEVIKIFELTDNIYYSDIDYRNLYLSMNVFKKELIKSNERSRIKRVSLNSSI